MQLDQMRGWLKALAVLVALVAGFPAAAWAHAGHEHGTQPPSSHAVSFASGVLATAAGQPLRLVQLTPHELNAFFALGRLTRLDPNLDAAPADEPVQPEHQSNCCCGSVACHAGVDLATLTVTDPWRTAAKVELPPVLALAGAVPGGIERPPRGGHPALGGTRVGPRLSASSAYVGR